MLNYVLPLDGVMSMHCSANVGPEGDTALFFALSGTGKTTLSADPARRLIGDDEHGCYAKVIRLSPTAEPQVYACTWRFGTILGNMTLDAQVRLLDLKDEGPADHALAERMAGHLNNIIFLRCDAAGCCRRSRG